MATVEVERAAAEWFIAHTVGLSEKLAAAHLERKGFEVYLPMRETKSKRTDAAAIVPFIPRYLFVAVDVERPRWHDIVATPGVSTLIRSAGGDRPVRCPDRLIAEIRSREVYGLVQMNPPRPKAVAPARPGDRVRVTDGAWSGFDGLFEEMIDARRVMILLSLFGRQTRVEVAPSAVRKAG